MKRTTMNISEYLKKGFDNCIKQNKEDCGTLIGLPYPYTVPAIDHFDEMYYWDTYFTNKGLAQYGRFDMVKNNTDNMLYLVDKFGFMPNGNRTYYLGNSQPPFLSMMVRDVYEHYLDKDWLKKAYNTLKIEYDFWMTKRMTPIGLNCYGGYVSEADVSIKAASYRERTNTNPDLSDREVAETFIAFAESGWDMNPRFEGDAKAFAPVDLNSLLWAFEDNMKYFSCELKLSEEKLWFDRKIKRKSLMEKYLLNDNVFYDYNFKNNKLSSVLSGASFFPCFVKAFDKKEYILKVISKLESNYGIFTCEKNDIEGNYQWDYPMGWACLQYVAAKALYNCGCMDDALRVSQKFISLIEKVFEKTENLWEKYNVEEGNIDVVNEYDMPSMMGWTAGTYIALQNFIKTKII